MRKQNYTHNYLRTIANELASIANKFFNKAKGANGKYQYYAHKVSIIRDFLLNSPWVLFTVLYFLILVVDAVLMKPIIQVVVQHGFRMQSDVSLYLFIAIYVLLVSALTIGVAYGFSKLFDHKLRELQIELETVSRPGIAKTVIADEVLQEEHRERRLGIVFGILLMALLVFLSLYRNYIVNDFHLKFDSPDDYLNIIIPIALGIALCFFGLYKDVMVRLVRFKSKVKHYEDEKDNFQYQADHYARLAIEQDNEAIKNGETIPYSAELKEVKSRYENSSQIYNDIYDEVKKVQIHLFVKGMPMPNIQVMAITGDNNTIYQTSGSDGVAIIRWTTDVDFIRNIKIGPYDLNGNKWIDGQKVSVDLEDFINQKKPQLNGATYLEERLLSNPIQ